MAKIQHKRERALEKAWYIVKPFLVYTVVKTIAIFGLALLLPSIPIEGFDVWVEKHSQLLSTTINGIAALIGVMVVLREFIKEMYIETKIKFLPVTPTPVASAPVIAEKSNTSLRRRYPQRITA